MKLYTREIETCDQCPDCRQRFGGNDMNCEYRGRHRGQIGWMGCEPFEIPSWCPLPDCEDKDEG